MASPKVALVHNPQVHIIILAAGLGSRLGGGKLLLELGGRPLYAWALDAALDSAADGVVLVGSQELLDRLPSHPRLQAVLNPQPERGQASSLGLGLAALPPWASHVLFMLADQPLVGPDLLGRFVGLARAGVELAWAAGADYQGPPALFSRAYFQRLAALRGDEGARRILAAPGENPRRVPLSHQWQGLDVDRPQDLAQAQEILAWREQGVHNLAQALDLTAPALLSLVGAGGKTSALERLARELTQEGRRVLVSTTTHIFPPPWPLILEPDPDALAAKLQAGFAHHQVLAAAAGLDQSQTDCKLRGLDPRVLDRLLAQGAADFILVEADGARHLPLKAPREHEPVIPEACGLVLGLMGLSVLGRPLGPEAVMAPELFSALTGAALGYPLEPGNLLRLAEHPQGLFKSAPAKARRVALLNQLDALHGRPELEQVLAMRPRPPLELWAGSLGLGFFQRLGIG